MPSIIDSIIDIYPALLRGTTIIQYFLHERFLYAAVINCELFEVEDGLVQNLIDKGWIAFIQSDPVILGISISGQMHGGIEKPGKYWIAEMRDDPITTRLVYKHGRMGR